MDSFLIPVYYKGLEQQFPASLQQRGYLPTLHINIYGTTVIFERDEEGNWRALVTAEEKGRLPDTQLLQAISETIDDILR